MGDIKVKLNNIGKRYGYEWVFKELTCSFDEQKSYAILGNNGSGKSTLMQIIAGSLMPSKGELSYQIEGKIIVPENYYTYLSWCAPYIEPINDFTLPELLRFQQQFKPFIYNLTVDDILKISELNTAKHKLLRYYSSGMKQRAKLVMAVLADTPILLLDEPTSNLDKMGIQWYQSLIQQYTQNRLIIVASNQSYEYDFCSEKIWIKNYR